jgi:hypothetical protein
MLKKLKSLIRLYMLRMMNYIAKTLFTSFKITTTDKRTIHVLQAHHSFDMLPLTTSFDVLLLTTASSFYEL